MNFRAIIILLCLAAAAPAQRPAAGAKNAGSDTTALGALKLLPKDAAKRVARIEAREGNPWPERWYVLIHEPGEPRGLREFVFAGGQQVAARTLSQFADMLSADDVIGADAIKVNSDTVAGVAGQFALHNGVRLGSVNYELLKTGTPPVPAWRLTCLDLAGDQIGTILVHAGKGTVIRFDGFEKAPFAEAAVLTAPKPVIHSKPAGGSPPAVPRAVVKPDARQRPPTPPPAARTAAPRGTVTKPFRAEPTPKPGAMRRIGDSVRKVFGRED